MTTQLPSLEEATKDLNDIRLELEAMRRIEHDAQWLSTRDDVTPEYFASIVLNVRQKIITGERLKQHILKLYPQLL